MSRRKDKTLVFINFVEALASLSACCRAKVGAIIIPHDLTRVLSIGYNGQPKGLSNMCSGEPGACNCIHAEANALIKLQGVYRSDLCMLTTTSPCAHCAGLIINYGCIDTVYYATGYRDPKGVNILRQAGISTYTFKEMLEMI